ncbi:hypothetical protein V3N99_08945 [Dermatophilaceae bacterium Soc4.6]
MITPLAVACLWGILAARSPTVTYHLAPMLLAASAPLTTFIKETRGRALPTGAATATGLAIALLTTGILDWQGLLAGPDLTGGHHAATEAAASAPLGAIIGWWLARRGHTANTNDP